MQSEINPTSKHRKRVVFGILNLLTSQTQLALAFKREGRIFGPKTEDSIFRYKEPQRACQFFSIILNNNLCSFVAVGLFLRRLHYYYSYYWKVAKNFVHLLLAFIKCDNHDSVLNYRYCSFDVIPIAR
jgi:hypothetical protein